MKGRTWCIEFLDDAKKDGDVSVTWKVIRGGQQQDIPGTWEGYRKGMTARQKADRFFNRLKNDPGMSRMVGVTRAGNTVCFQLKDGAPFDDIAGVKLGDETGQTFRVFDDPDTGSPLETVRFRLSGTPQTPNGVVRLGVGLAHCWAETPTHQNGEPLPVPAIYEGLVAAFNKVFGELGWTANVEDDEVVIPEVPCEEGGTGGTTDTGLDAQVGVVDPTITVIPDFDKFLVLRETITGIGARIQRIEEYLFRPVEVDQTECQHCHGRVIEVRLPDGTVRYYLICDGKCEEGECRKRRSVDHHGGVREWCGCDDTEPRCCHIVVVTPAPDREGNVGPQEVVCAGFCENERDRCKLVRERISKPDEQPQVFVLRCRCVPPN